MNPLYTSIFLFTISIVVIFCISWIGIWSTSKLKYLIIPFNILFFVLMFFSITNIFGQAKPIFNVPFWDEMSWTDEDVPIEFFYETETNIYMLLNINNRLKLYVFDNTPEVEAIIERADNHQKKLIIKHHHGFTFDTLETRLSESPDHHYPHEGEELKPDESNRPPTNGPVYDDPDPGAGTVYDFDKRHPGEKK